MTEDEEKYIHFTSCISDLNDAWNILRAIEEFGDRSFFVGCSFRLALIEYSKPYGNSYGTLKQRKLDERFIPLEYMELHRRILVARDQIHAHSDLKIRNARVLVKQVKSQKYVGII